MKHQWLHDTAKFGAGLVAADFLVLLWFTFQHTLPKAFLGLPISQSMLMPGMIVDVFLFIMLVHYGWNIGKIPHIKERLYLTVAGVIFTVVAGAHIVRMLYQGEVVFFGWAVPLFLSWIGAAVATYLAYASFYLATRLRR